MRPWNFRFLMIIQVANKMLEIIRDLKSVNWLLIDSSTF